MKRKFSTSWKSSKKPRKQVKFRKKAPLHTKQKFVSAHLSPELRKKHNKRAIPLRKGDKVKIMNGSKKGKTGKVGNIDLKKSKIYIEGFEVSKIDGTKSNLSFQPSNLMITELILEDKKRIKTEEKKNAH
ncbi:50S ribosomal protein L24 [Nanoarchaeota archaeon]